MHEHHERSVAELLNTNGRIEMRQANVTLDRIEPEEAHSRCSTLRYLASFIVVLVACSRATD